MPADFAVVAAQGMTDVNLFWRHRPTPPPADGRRETTILLARLDAIADRLETAYAKVEPMLRDTPRGKQS